MKMRALLNALVMVYTGPFSSTLQAVTTESGTMVSTELTPTTAASLPPGMPPPMPTPIFPNPFLTIDVINCDDCSKVTQTLCNFYAASGTRPAVMYLDGSVTASPLTPDLYKYYSVFKLNNMQAYCDNPIGERFDRLRVIDTFCSDTLLLNDKKNALAQAMKSVTSDEMKKKLQADIDILTGNTELAAKLIKTFKFTKPEDGTPIDLRKPIKTPTATQRSIIADLDDKLAQERVRRATATPLGQSLFATNTLCAALQPCVNALQTAASTLNHAKDLCSTFIRDLPTSGYEQARAALSSISTILAPLSAAATSATVRLNNEYLKDLKNRDTIAQNRLREQNLIASQKIVAPPLFNLGVTERETNLALRMTQQLMPAIQNLAGGLANLRSQITSLQFQKTGTQNLFENTIAEVQVPYITALIDQTTTTLTHYKEVIPKFNAKLLEPITP